MRFEESVGEKYRDNRIRKHLKLERDWKTSVTERRLLRLKLTQRKRVTGAQAAEEGRIFALHFLIDFQIWARFFKLS